MASNCMLRGQLPWGLGGAIYLLICLFVCAYLFINMRLLILSVRVFRDIIKNYLSMLDYIGALDRTV